MISKFDHTFLYKNIRTITTVQKIKVKKNISDRKHIKQFIIYNEIAMKILNYIKKFPTKK